MDLDADLVVKAVARTEVAREDIMFTIKRTAVVRSVLIQIHIQLSAVIFM